MKSVAPSCLRRRRRPCTSRSVSFFSSARSMQTLQARGVQRLLDEVVGALADGLHRGVDGAAAGEEDHRAVRQLVLERAQQPQPVGLRHRQVGEHHVGPELRRLLQRVGAVARRSPPCGPRGASISARASQVLRLVVDGEDSCAAHGGVESPASDVYGSDRLRAGTESEPQLRPSDVQLGAVFARRAAASACSTSVSAPSSRPPSCTCSTARVPSCRTETRTSPVLGRALDRPEHRAEHQEGERPRRPSPPLPPGPPGSSDRHLHPRAGAPRGRAPRPRRFTIAERREHRRRGGRGSEEVGEVAEHRVHPRDLLAHGLEVLRLSGREPRRPRPGRASPGGPPG